MTGILYEVGFLRWIVRRAPRLFFCVPRWVKRGAIRLFRSSLAAILFSFGLLKAVSWMMFSLSGNLCLLLLATTLIFAPALPVLSLVFMIPCLLILDSKDRP